MGHTLQGVDQAENIVVSISSTETGRRGFPEGSPSRPLYCYLWRCLYYRNIKITVLPQNRDFEVKLFSDLKFCGFCGVGLTDGRAARRAAPTALELDAGYNDFRGFCGLRLTDERACQFVQKRAHRATRLCRS